MLDDPCSVNWISASSLHGRAHSVVRSSYHHLHWYDSLVTSCLCYLMVMILLSFMLYQWSSWVACSLCLVSRMYLCSFCGPCLSLFCWATSTFMVYDLLVCLCLASLDLDFVFLDDLVHYLDGPSMFVLIACFMSPSCWSCDVCVMFLLWASITRSLVK